jgi:hypothetical protein
MDIEGILMVGIVGLTIAIGNYYEHRTPKVDLKPIIAIQGEFKAQVRGKGYILSNNRAYMLENGVLTERAR